MGVFGPLLIVFKGKRVKSEWLMNVPENVMIKCSDDGWINKGLFLEFGKKFVSWLPKTDKRPHVLLMDGHGSHVFNLDFLNLMKANNVEVFCFPPHTTHWLQPADKAVFKTFKTEWVKEGLKFNKDTAGRKPSKVEFIQLFKKAWEKAATIEVVQGGFRGTGMFPWNPRAIPDVAYYASAATERLYEISSENNESCSDVGRQAEPQIPAEPQASAEPQTAAEPLTSAELQAASCIRTTGFSRTTNCSRATNSSRTTDFSRAASCSRTTGFSNKERGYIFKPKSTPSQEPLNQAQAQADSIPLDRTGAHAVPGAASQ